MTQGRTDEATEMNKQISKQKKQDKIIWINKLTDEAKKCKDLWDGAREIGQDYKTCTYAKKDMHGNTAPLGERARATKEDLEKEQWGRKQNQETAAEKQEKKPSQRKSKKN